MSKLIGESGREALTERQQAFADFIAKRVNPVEKHFRETRDYHEANLLVNPRGQLVPITSVELVMYERVPLEEELTGLEEDQPKPEPYTAWGIEMKNNTHGIDSSLYLAAHEGFSYRSGVDASIETVSDEFGKNILDSLIAAEEAGLITPS